jgi:putative ABC transport system permease protein
VSVALWPLVRLSLTRDRRSALSSAFGLSVGVASLVFFVSLGLGVGRVVREKVFPVDSSLVEVVPASFSLGLLGGGTLDEVAVARLEALPGVSRVFKKMNVRAPAVTLYRGDFFGRPLHMGLEVLAVGVEPDFVRRDVLMGDFVDQGPDQPIPALASTRLLEIYNKSFAPQRSLPQLSGQMLTGFVFPIDFNRSFVTATPPSASSIPAQAQLVGVSDRALLAGVTIPLDTARRLNRLANLDDSTFTAVTVQTADPSAVPGVVTAVKAMGLSVDDQERRMAENAGAAVAISTSSLALLSVLICVLAAFNIAHAFSAAVRAREKELGVMRAVGAAAGAPRRRRRHGAGGRRRGGARRRVGQRAARVPVQASVVVRAARVVAAGRGRPGGVRGGCGGLLAGAEGLGDRPGPGARWLTHPLPHDRRRGSVLCLVLRERRVRFAFS